LVEDVFSLGGAVLAPCRLGFLATVALASIILDFGHRMRRHRAEDLEQLFVVILRLLTELHVKQGLEELAEGGLATLLGLQTRVEKPLQKSLHLHVQGRVASLRLC